jgi:cysteinyl-tRNA synthetase
MITVNGQKMGKSLGNSILLDEFFTGRHPLLTQAYTPMTIRFFILQAHYRSTLDFSNDALQAAEKGLKRLLEAARSLEKLAPSAAAAAASVATVDELAKKIYEALDDDLNTPVALAHLFDVVRLINAAGDGKEALAPAAVERLRELFRTVVSDILGLRDDAQAAGSTALLDGVLHLLLDLRAAAKAAKDFATSDQIRDKLAALGIRVKDGKAGSSYSIQ